jgi:hypothetical protein
MKIDRSRSRLVLWGAIVAVVLVFAWRLLPGERSLLDAAAIRYSLNGKSFVAWLTNTEAIVLRREQTTVIGAHPILHPYIVNVSTGMETPLANLEECWLKERLQAVYVRGEPCTVSLQDKSLLLKCYFRPKNITLGTKPLPEGYYRYYVLDARTRTVKGLPIDSKFQLAFWRPNSDSMLALYINRMQNSDSSVSSKRIVTYFPETNNDKHSAPFPWPVEEDREIPLGYAGDGRFMTALNLGPYEGSAIGGEPARKISPEVALSGYTVDSELREITRRNVPYPPGFRLQYPIISAASNRMLWLAYPERPAEPPYWLKQVRDRIALLSPGAHEQRPSLWVSDLDGKSMREIGFVLDGDHKGFFEPSWLPDGRNISFEDHGMLYVVPVP